MDAVRKRNVTSTNVSILAKNTMDVKSIVRLLHPHHLVIVLPLVVIEHGLQKSCSVQMQVQV